ncbi:hypothetical protein [Sporosarcina cascadiensis]|uniref:hypothetical protein n=1 Tax=Sporosarcina cascadiensis TaxID=2660747 RepID=UPI00129ACE6B|nr:hypothetical protein [Sporosarcina cascadiensis]
MKRNGLFLFIALLLVLAGCSSKPATSLDGNSSSKDDPIKDEQTNENQSEQESAEKTDVSLLDYFLPDGSSAHYKGEGNEYAELDITVDSPTEDYVVVHENNGGSFIQKVYKLEGDEIQILQEQPVEIKAELPNEEELQAMQPIGIYLKGPIEKGTKFEDWEITETDATVETPYQKFDEAIVMEQKDEDYINRKYLVKGFGEVKRESIMTTEKDFIVTSTLETVTK